MVDSQSSGCSGVAFVGTRAGAGGAGGSRFKGSGEAARLPWVDEFVMIGGTVSGRPRTTTFLGSGTGEASAWTRESPARLPASAQGMVSIWIPAGPSRTLRDPASGSTRTTIPLEGRLSVSPQLRVNLPS